MKSSCIVAGALLLVACFAAGCKNDTANAGASALQDKDDIRVKSDTFSIHSSLGKSAAIYMSTDSFLLGECDTHFGTIKADILTQLACPEGFAYPVSDELQVDSVCLNLYYTRWYGDGQAPLSITVYEMDGSALSYYEKYPSDTALTAFCSLADSTHITPQSRIILAGAPTDTAYSTSGATTWHIRVKLSDAFARRFFAIRDFSSQKQFNECFKGLYITTDFGGSTVLYVTDISMSVYYQFRYPKSEAAGDTLLTDIKTFYANSEVRQINRYVYPDRDEIVRQLSLVQDTNFVVAPANIYTRLSVRMDSIFRRMEERLGDPADYRVYVNQANLTVDVLYNSEQSSTRPRDTWDTPAQYMLLIKEEYAETFFAQNKLPSDTAAILGTLTQTTDSLSNVSYSYSYDLSTLLTNMLRADTHPDELTFVLVPVSVTTSTSSSYSSSTVTAVRQLQTISATCIRSADNSTEPMDIEVVYAGFNKRKN